jgi:hypothetical protein
METIFCPLSRPASVLFARRAERTAAMSELPASSGDDAAIGADYAPISRAAEALEGEFGGNAARLAPCADDDGLAGRLDEIAVDDADLQDGRRLI